MPLGLALGAATVGGALITAGAAKKASKTQADAANQATQTQLEMFNTARSDLAPYNTAGQAATTTLASLYGLNGQTPDYSSF